MKQLLETVPAPAVEERAEQAVRRLGTALDAARVRLAFGKLLHQRLASDVLITFDEVLVLELVGGLVVPTYLSFTNVLFSTAVRTRSKQALLHCSSMRSVELFQHRASFAC